MLRLLALAAALALAACTPSTPATTPDARGAAGPLAPPDVTEPGQPGPDAAPAPAEAFADFFERFRADTLFQRTRVADGFAYRAMEETAESFELVEQPDPFRPASLEWIGPERIRTTFAPASDAPAADGSDPPGTTESPAGLDPDVDAVDYQIAGLDNGVDVRYRFVRGSDGLWRLAEIVNGSM